MLSAARHSREMVKIKGLSDTLSSKWEKTENYSYSENLNFFGFPPLPSSRRRPGEGKLKSCSRRPRVHTEICFYSTENLCALLPFAFICTYTDPLPRPIRANPAPDERISYLLERGNKSLMASSSVFAFMVISFRKGGETICDSIRRGFLCLNLIYKSHFCFRTALLLPSYCAKLKLKFMWNFRLATYFMFIKKLPFYVFNKSPKYFPTFSSLCCLYYVHFLY